MEKDYNMIPGSDTATSVALASMSAHKNSSCIQGQNKQEKKTKESIKMKPESKMPDMTLVRGISAVHAGRKREVDFQSMFNWQGELWVSVQVQQLPDGFC